MRSSTSTQGLRVCPALCSRFPGVAPDNVAGLGMAGQGEALSLWDQLWVGPRWVWAILPGAHAIPCMSPCHPQGLRDGRGQVLALTSVCSENAPHQVCPPGHRRLEPHRAHCASSLRARHWGLSHCSSKADKGGSPFQLG